MRRLGYLVLAVAAVLTAMVTNAAATPQPVVTPEIDPGSVTASLGLLTGGVMLLRARFRK